MGEEVQENNGQGYFNSKYGHHGCGRYDGDEHRSNTYHRLPDDRNHFELRLDLQEP